ncbi:hypothetical protein O181_046375 [Austropuccinia psidii MF-1]|uniref:Uncharacterized protein n=1 Tax=Austropuccinia psidii MF-1 TaxID=1389203 RepID=A0A9Q3DT81_9BASI|nr:hypothetical protein [Austropuccinia psidii MF-1]
METCAVSKLEDWKELPVEKLPSYKNQEISEEHTQVFKEEGIKESEENVEIKVGLALFNTDDIKKNPKEINLTGITIPKRENGNTFNQISQAINSDNFKNHENIQRKSLTKLLLPIKAFKSLSKGKFKNNCKSSIKPVATIVRVSSESKGLSSQIVKSALKSSKEVSLKYNISKKKDIINQNHLKLQEENIDIIPKSEEYASLNEILNATSANSHCNKNTYPQEISTSNEGASKIINKQNFHQRESVLPQELIDSTLRFNQVNITGATHKNKYNHFEKSQTFVPSYFEHIDPRILMEKLSGENKSFPNMENIYSKLITEELDLEKTIENPIGENEQNKVKCIPFCLEEEPSKMEFPCFNSTRKDIECSFSTFQNINEANMDESTYEKSSNSLSQLTIKKELNQQKTLHPQDKFSVEAYNNCNLERKVDSRFKKLQSIRNHSRDEFIKNTIKSLNILEDHPPGTGYGNKERLFCQMAIQEEAEYEHKSILTEEELPWEGYTNWQPLRDANLVEKK